MLVLERNPVAVDTERRPSTSPARHGAEAGPPRDANKSRPTLRRAVPDPQADRIESAGIDHESLRWLPVVVPLLAVLISGCILAIWSIL